MNIQLTLTEPQMKSLLKFYHRASLNGSEVGEYVQLSAVLGAAVEKARQPKPPELAPEPAPRDA